MDLHLYGGPKSRAFRVIWMLEELGLEYRHSLAAPRSDEVVALNGSGKIPVLVVDGTAISDSTAIITFLADRTGALTYPAGTLDRARQDGWTGLINDEFDSVLWTASRHSFALPEDRRVPEVKDSLKWEFARSAARLAERFDGPFLMGETMTIADILLTHCLGWAAVAKFPDTGPVLTAYRDEMRRRPAYGRALASAM
jgi:glutathione S-transferase